MPRDRSPAVRQAGAAGQSGDHATMVTFLAVAGALPRLRELKLAKAGQWSRLGQRVGGGLLIIGVAAVAGARA